MKNTYIVIIVIVLIAGALFFGLRGKKLEAPTDGEKSGVNDISGAVTNEMPVLGESGVEEMIVNPGGGVEVKEFTVTGKNFSFTPSLITVKKGDRVKITFKSSQGFHDFTLDQFGVATKQMQAPDEEVLEFTTDKVGSFEYYCSVGSHRTMGMKGILKVE